MQKKFCEGVEQKGKVDAYTVIDQPVKSNTWDVRKGRSYQCGNEDTEMDEWGNIV